jgi:hypothetical protein
MAIFAVRKQRINKCFQRSVVRSSVLAISAMSALLGCSSVVSAVDTNGGISPVAIAFPPGALVPYTPPTTNPPWYAYIFNEYLLVSVGLTNNSWAVPNINTDVPGRISFGTIAGNLRISQDDNQPLVGGISNVPSLFPGLLGLPEGQWPYGHGDGLTTTVDPTGNYMNYPAYLRAVVDGTQVNVGFDTAQNRWFAWERC